MLAFRVAPEGSGAYTITPEIEMQAVTETTYLPALPEIAANATWPALIVPLEDRPALGDGALYWLGGTAIPSAHTALVPCVGALVTAPVVSASAGGIAVYHAEDARGTTRPSVIIGAAPELTVSRPTPYGAERQTAKPIPTLVAAHASQPSSIPTPGLYTYTPPKSSTTSPPVPRPYQASVGQPTPPTPWSGQGSNLPLPPWTGGRGGPVGPVNNWGRVGWPAFLLIAAFGRGILQYIGFAATNPGLIWPIVAPVIILALIFLFARRRGARRRRRRARFS